MSRELDALVAEHVMGWDVRIIPDFDNNKVYRTKNSYGQFTVNVRPYSTDIAAAWDVMEKFDMWDLGNNANNSLITAEFKTFPNPWVGEVADTAPLAICKAALKAKGVEYDK